MKSSGPPRTEVVATNGEAGRNLTYAGGFLGLSPHTVRLLVKRRELSHYRLGRRLVFRDEDLRAFMAARRVEVE
jgi:excisionase family DNA binding protein